MCGLTMMKIVFMVIVMCLMSITCGGEETRSEDESQGNQLNEQQINNFQNSLSLSTSSNTNCSEKLPEVESIETQPSFIPGKSDYDKLLERLAQLESVVQQNQKSVDDLINGLKLNISLQTKNNDAKKLENAPNKVVPEDRCKTATTSGIYKIQHLNKDVYCEMTTFGGGWMVIQLVNYTGYSTESFDRSWTEYQAGFGTVRNDKGFWVGLEVMHKLTNNGDCELAVELKDHKENYEYVRYSEFYVAGKDDMYRLTVDGDSGTAGVGLIYHNNMKFSTKDIDNDNYSKGNCAYNWMAGWWYNDCSEGRGRCVKEDE